MPMPYTIERFPGPGGEKRPYKVYPGGSNCPASPEEVQAWEHVQELEAYREDSADRFAAVVRQRDEAEAKLRATEQAAPPAPALVQAPVHTATAAAVGGGGKGGRK